jgi:hypothetical protein
MLNINDHKVCQQSSYLRFDVEDAVNRLAANDDISAKTCVLLAAKFQMVSAIHGRYELLSVTVKKNLHRFLLAQAQELFHLDQPAAYAHFLLAAYYLSGALDNPDARFVHAFLARTIECAQANTVLSKKSLRKPASIMLRPLMAA